jgi:hypothetical protein
MNRLASLLLLVFPLVAGGCCRCWEPRYSYPQPGGSYQQCAPACAPACAPGCTPTAYAAPAATAAYCPPGCAPATAVPAATTRPLLQQR